MHLLWVMRRLCYIYKSRDLGTSIDGFSSSWLLGLNVFSELWVFVDGSTDAISAHFPDCPTWPRTIYHLLESLIWWCRWSWLMPSHLLAILQLDAERYRSSRLYDLPCYPLPPWSEIEDIPMLGHQLQRHGCKQKHHALLSVETVCLKQALPSSVNN